MTLFFDYFLLLVFSITVNQNPSQNIFVGQKSETSFQKSTQEEVMEEDLFGDWYTWAKTSNKYRSNPYQAPRILYSFKRDYSIRVMLKNKTSEGSWVLSDKGEITIIIDGKTQIYRITHFKDNSMILMGSNSYLSLKKQH